MTDIDMPTAPLEQPAVDVRQLHEQITVLTERLKLAQQMTSEARRNHQADIEWIGQKLMSEAEQRDWCDQYDKFVEEVNNQLHVELPTRYIDYTAEIRITVSYTALPSQSHDIANDIAYAIYNHGDSLGNEEYEVTQTDVWDVAGDR